MQKITFLSTKERIPCIIITGIHHLVVWLWVSCFRLDCCYHCLKVKIFDCCMFYLFWIFWIICTWKGCSLLQCECIPNSWLMAQWEVTVDRQQCEFVQQNTLTQCFNVWIEENIKYYVIHLMEEKLCSLTFYMMWGVWFLVWHIVKNNVIHHSH